MENQKKWFKRHPILTGIICFFIILFIIGIFIPDDSQIEDKNSVNFESLDNDSLVNIPTQDEAKEDIIEVKQELQTATLYKITGVIDGDTVELITGERVRLICINTPEKGERGFSEATSYLESLVLDKNVILEKDISETDKYGRLLRYIYLEDIFINEQIVRNGYGFAYPYNPDTSKCPIIEDAEEKAKQEKIGLWADTQTKSSSSEVICSSNYYNCDDFSTHAEAQAVLDECGTDIHKLDQDKDGIACESLP